jgi:hypothetical protein
MVSNAISATTYQNLPIDIFVTGGTYSNGVTTFTNNSGNTFSVAGYFTGYTDVVNILTTGIGLSGDTTSGNITIINTSPDQIVTISGETGITTGGTYPNFTITNSAPDQTVILNDGNNISVVGTYPNFTINVTGLTDNDRYVTGFSYNNNTFTIGDNSGNTYDATFNDVTGLTVNGTLSATTISGGTLYGDGSNLTNLNYWQYNSGSVQHFQGAKTWSTNTLTANRFYGAPMEIKTDVVITDMKLFVTSPIAGASVVGIYDVIGGVPTNLIVQSTAFNNGVGGLQTYTFPSPISLSKGLYVVALHTSSGMDIRTVSFNTTIDFLGLVPTLAFTENLYYAFRGAITYNATMPLTWPITAVLDLGNDARMPLIGFTIQ